MEKSRVTDWQRNTKEGKPPWNQRTIATHYRLITASSLHPLALTARDVPLLQPMSAGLPGYFRFDDLTAASSAVGPRLGSQRGSWLIIQRKWTKEREGWRVAFSSDQKSAAKARAGKNGEAWKTGGWETERCRRERRRKWRDGEREKDSPHKHLECDTMVSSAHIKALVQGA